MTLTGKCKADFEEWFCSGSFQLAMHYRHFKDCPDSMKWGVLVDFFDSKNVFISIESVFDRMLGYNRGFEVHLYQDGKQSITLFEDDDVFNARSQARTAAILKANEIYNERYEILKTNPGPAFLPDA